MYGVWLKGSLTNPDIQTSIKRFLTILNVRPANASDREWRRSFKQKWLGCKWTLCISFMAYMPYIAAQFYPAFYTLIPAALFVGFGGGPLWCAKCTYLTVASEAYSKISGVPADVLVIRYFGIFFMIFQFSQVWGNLISSLVITAVLFIWWNAMVTSIDPKFTKSVSNVILRRRISTNVEEFWNYLSYELRRVKNDTFRIPHDDSLQESFENVLSFINENIRLLHSNINQLNEYDGYIEWRENESNELSRLVQARLKHLQNPTNCSKARKLVCHLKFNCGFGCHVHHILTCLVYAYATERILILNTNGWQYTENGWSDLFIPLSDTCTEADGPHLNWPGHNDTQIVHLNWIGYERPDPYLRVVAVPEDLAQRVERFHGDPALWWIGQILKYILRPNKQTESMIQQRIKEIEYQKPIVGVHIRRTDKIGGEAMAVPIDTYLEHVENYFKIEEIKNPFTRRIYLATDDPSIIPQVRNIFQNYIVLANPNGTNYAVDNKKRFTKDSLKEIILDIMLLANSDYLVCTFTSNFGRLSFELMQAFHLDAADKAKSLDFYYHYWGEKAHFQEAVLGNDPENPNELQIGRGDLVSLEYNYGHGFSSGERLQTAKHGYFPSFKVPYKFPTAKYPTYPEVA